jgi:hypothetical protein
LAFKTHEILDHIIYYLRNAAVKIESIDVAETIKTTKALIETEASLSTIKHQFSHVQELIERFFKIQREAGFCFD